MDPSMSPIAADGVEIYVIVDNYVDGGLPASLGVQRYSLGHDGKLPINSYLAEHAISLMVTAFVGDKSHRIILDAGCSPEALPHNLDFGNVDLDGVTDVVISHGHEDHMGALPQLLSKMPNMAKVYAHPAAFHSPRYYLADSGELLEEPTFERGWITSANAELIETLGPTRIGKGLFLITGEIPRKNDFEKALPGSLMAVDGKLVPDKIADDQAVVVVLKNHGLVVLTGCAHAGIINTVDHARRLTGIDRVYAVIGGFHLSGEPFRHALQPTLEEFGKMDPTVLVPMHCTGIEAKALLYSHMPDRIKISGVGTTFRFPLS
jgi:7,8-dihydropterin-6-yl-methyl-4-(beta-D-ribofuranosyl)aminobenzene 5'-phosphate synthase